MKIVKYPNPILKTVCELVTDFDQAAIIAGQMHQTLAESDIPGIGISAPQVGILQRIIVIDTRVYNNGILAYMFNPKIISTSNSMVISEEGCLSFPGETCRVKRHTWVKVQYRDLTGLKITDKLEGIDALVFQHEYDHLNGITFEDYRNKDLNNGKSL